MWKCAHCAINFDFNKTADKANHSRWCDSNPKKNHYRNNKVLEIAVRNSKDKKYGKEKTYKVECCKCKKLFSVVEREKNFPSKERYYCSRTCANSHIVTEAHRKKTSESLTGRIYSPPKLLTAECSECHNSYEYIKHYTSKPRTFCSQSCAAKFSSKKRNAEARLKRSALKNYRADCAFKFNLADYPDEFDFMLIEQYGWYKAKNRGNNLQGVSRDHMVSVRYGFDNNIPAEHLSHPANCKLIRHGENVSKGKKNSISYEELLEKIKTWNRKYKNSNKCSPP